MNRDGLFFPSECENDPASRRGAIDFSDIIHIKCAIAHIKEKITFAFALYEQTF